MLKKWFMLFLNFICTTSFLIAWCSLSVPLIALLEFFGIIISTTSLFVGIRFINILFYKYLVDDTEGEL